MNADERRWSGIRIAAMLLCAVLLSACAALPSSESRPYSVRHAMELYRVAHPVCEACGGMPVAVHHIQPYEPFPALREAPSNFISLCARCHLCLGHPAGNTHHWNINVRECARLLKEGTRK